MLRKLLRDDICGSARYFFPAALTLLAIGGISAFFCGRFYANTDEAVLRALAVLEPLQYYCRQLLMAAALPAVLLRSRDTLCGGGAYFWLTVPVRPWKHIISKLICTALMFVLSAAMYGTVQLILLRSDRSGSYAQMYLYGFSNDPVFYRNRMILGAASLLFVMMCIQSIIEGAALFASPCRSSKAVTWAVSLTALLFTASFYAGGHAVIGRLTFIASGRNAGQLLGYSYSCAFFAVMTIVYTVIDIQLLGRRAEVSYYS